MKDEQIGWEANFVCHWCQFALTIYLHLVPEPEVVLVDELMELLFVL